MPGQFVHCEEIFHPHFSSLVGTWDSYKSRVFAVPCLILALKSAHDFTQTLLTPRFFNIPGLIRDLDSAKILFKMPFLAEIALIQARDIFFRKIEECCHCLASKNLALTSRLSFSLPSSVYIPRPVKRCKRPFQNFQKDNFQKALGFLCDTEANMAIIRSSKPSIARQTPSNFYLLHSDPAKKWPRRANHPGGTQIIPVSRPGKVPSGGVVVFTNRTRSPGPSLKAAWTKMSSLPSHISSKFLPKHPEIYLFEHPHKSWVE